MAKSGAYSRKSVEAGAENRVKLVQRGLYFRDWYLDRPIQILTTADKQIEKVAKALGTGVSSADGAIGIALHIPNHESFLRLIAQVDARLDALVLGGTVDVAALLSAFPHRRVRAYRHASQFPYGLTRCEDHEADVAVVGELPEPEWPRIGLTMPVVENGLGAARTVKRLLATYPGALDVVVVANGSSDETLSQLLALEGELSEHVWVVREETNLGFPGGVNVGLQELWTESWYDLFAIAHDDLIPSLTAISEMVDAFKTLQDLGQRPAVIGPATNKLEGPQGAQLPAYDSIDELEERAMDRFTELRRSADEAERVGSHLMLIDCEALSDIGGLDPIFGRGYFCDDDWCLRARLGGYRIWIASGAYVHHEGATTFNHLKADEGVTLSRNNGLFSQKWNSGAAEGNERIYLPLLKGCQQSEFIATFHGEKIDLIHQASSIELAAYLTSNLEEIPRIARIEILEALHRAIDAHRKQN